MADYQPTSQRLRQRRPDMMTAPLAVSPTFAGKSAFLALTKRLESLMPSASDQKEYLGLLLALREAYLGPHQKATMPGIPLETGQQVPLAEAPMSKGASSTGKSETGEERPNKSSRGEEMSDLNIILARNLKAQLSVAQQPVQERNLPSRETEPRIAVPDLEAVSVSTVIPGSGRKAVSESLSLLEQLDESVGLLGVGVLSERENAKGLLAQLRRRLSSLRASD